MKLPEPSGRYRPLRSVSKLSKVTPLKTAVFLSLGFVGSVAFDTRDVSAGQERPAATAHGTLPIAAPIVPGNDEFALRRGAERLLRREAEVHDIVRAMPGPDGPLNATSAPPANLSYTNPYEEILARLGHAKQLVEDVRLILVAMPAPALAPTPTTTPPPVPEPTVTPAAAPAATEPGAAKTRTIQDAARDAFTPITATRITALVIGSLIALALVKCLPRFFRNRRYEYAHAIKQLPPKDIEAPPLQDQALELADVMASMGLTDGAAHALVERIRANPRQALSHWLKLLEVYRQAGRKTDFETAAAEVKNNFNIRPGNWSPRTEEREASNVSLESYPHIVAQLKKLWPKPQCGDYLLNLLADNREGKRAGFPLPVVEEIVLLLAVLRAEEATGDSHRIIDVNEVAREPELTH